MGTNYDAVPVKGVRVHLGKMSATWPFLFRCHDWTDHEAWAEWVATATSYRIEDEYGREHTFAQLMAKIVESYVAYNHRQHDDAFLCGAFQFHRGDFC